MNFPFQKISQPIKDMTKYLVDLARATQSNFEKIQSVSLVRFRGVLSAAPTVDVQEGDIYYNKGLGQHYLYSGGSWNTI